MNLKSAYDAPSELTLSSGRRESASKRAGRSSAASSGWLEVVALSLLVPLGIACVAPGDPLLRAAPFPWLVLVPLLLGAWHGALAGALSTALIVSAATVYVELTSGPELDGLASFSGGCLAIGVLAGFFRDRTQARLTSLEQRASESARELSRVGRAHVVLELSHRQLEERLAARNWSIAAAFRDAQRGLAGGASLATVGDVVLGVLSNHAFVQSATLVSATPGPGGRHELRASSSINGPARLDLEHRLVQRALESGRLVALDAEGSDLEAGESIVAVAPLRSVSGNLLGLVLVHEMPFLAFQAENLENLAALTALLADVLEERFLDAAADEARVEAADGDDARASETRPRSGLAASAAESAAEDVPRSAVGLRSPDSQRAPASSRRVRGLTATRTGTYRRRRFAQSA
jgi:polysaccharide biosynthesis protein PelD